MIFKGIINACKDKKVILIDFFDTLMFRQVHSHQLMKQWEIALKKKYLKLKDIDLYSLRKQVINKLGADECAIDYRVLIDNIFKIANIEKFNINKEEFVELSYLIDMSIDMSTQFPNLKLINILKTLKSKYNKKIYIVSDYYLPKKCYSLYLKPYEMEEFFDGIFCSCDIGKTKYNGNLYSYILKNISYNASEVIMIGDSKVSDYDNSIKFGITAYRYFPVFHKIKTNIRKYKKFNYRNKICQMLFKNAYKNTIFGEYALNLYYFTKKLNDEINKINISSIGFLSRGGYLLKVCYDRYKLLVNNKKKVATNYIKNSRKVNNLAIENSNDQILLDKYLKQFVKDNRLCVIDEGWYCSSQIMFQHVLNYEVYGFYLGIMERKMENKDCNRKGLLFDINENGKKTPLFGVFRTNCTFYEQLLSAPHGSTIKYVFACDKVNVIEKWEEIEKNNYERNIKRIQEVIVAYFTGLVAWNAELSLYELSKYVLKSQIFASARKLQLLKEINDSWYDNANDSIEKKFNNLKKIKISIIELLVKPEEYLRYFCKLKELQPKYLLMKLVYPILGLCIYIYCKFSILIRYGRKNDKKINIHNPV